jgi:hypothetical protein
MRRAALIAFAVTVVAGAAWLLVRGSNNPRFDVLSLGVVPRQPIATLTKGERLCQTPVGLPGTVDRAVMAFGVPKTESPAGGRVRVTIRAGGPRGRVLQQKILGRSDLTYAPVGFQLDGPVKGGQEVAVCVQALDVAVDVVGDVNVSAAGPPPRFADRVTVNPTQTNSTAIVGNEDLQADVFLAFPFAHSTHQLSQTAAAVDHAAVFKLGAPWFLWLVLALAFLGGPLLLARALAAAGDD